MRPVYAVSERCGAPSGRVRCAKLGSHTAPRLCGDILMPLPPRLTSVPARAGHSAQLAGLTWASQPRRRRVRTPEAGPLAGARVRRAGFRPPVVRAHLRRRSPALSCQDGPDTHPSRGRDGRSLAQARGVGISGAEVRHVRIADIAACSCVRCLVTERTVQSPSP